MQLKEALEQIKALEKERKRLEKEKAKSGKDASPGKSRSGDEERAAKMEELSNGWFSFR